MPTAFTKLKQMIGMMADGDLTKKYCNPLQAKIGGIITIDRLDMRDMHFVVTSISEYTRNITMGYTVSPAGGTPSTAFKSAAYDMAAKPIDKPAVSMRLLVESGIYASNQGGLSMSGFDRLDANLMLLSEFDRLAFDPGLDKVVREEFFTINSPNGTSREYARLNGLKHPYEAKSLRCVTLITTV